MPEIWGIILAAGESKRMGSPKMILPYRGITIIESVIAAVSASNIEKTVVVVGSDKDKVLPLTDKYPVMHCYNSHYSDGMLSSVKCGLEFLPEDFRAAVFFLGDQPMIDPTVIDLVIEAYKNTTKGIVMPVFRGRRGHPLLVDRRYRDEICGLNDTEGLKGVVTRNPDDVLEVETDNPAILKDIDTQQEYINELNHID